MQITDNTPTRTVTIAGNLVAVPQPYAEGHQLRENEAHALNQVFAENLRNNLSQKLKDAATEGADQNYLQAMVDEYAKEYDFGMKSTGSGAPRTKDPVEKEAQSIARERVKTALKNKGFKLSGEDGIAKEQVDKLVGQALEQHPEIYEKAREIVNSRESVAADIGDDLAA